MKKVVLRTSGFGLYLFLFLDAFITALLVYALIVIINQIFSTNKIGVWDVLGLLLLLLLFVRINLYIFINIIRLTEQHLDIRFLSYGILPKIRTSHIDLLNIQKVIIGNEKFVREVLQDNRSWNTVSKNFYKQFISHRSPGASDVSRFALGYMDVFVICTKDDKIEIINTKPFSAAGFRKLIIGLRKNNIEVLVGSKILNRRLK